MSIEFRKIDIAQGADLSRLRELNESKLEAKSSESGGATFGDFLKNLAQEANTSQLHADRKIQEVTTGRNKDLHGAVLAMEKAEIQMRLLSQVRNKVIEAYKEIMRMQV